MPTYFARGITVKLGVLPLTDAVTQKIVLRKGDLAKKQCERAERQLLKSNYLKEQRIKHDNEEGNFELHWLGDVVPYMQSQIGLLDEHGSFEMWKEMAVVKPKDKDRRTGPEIKNGNERAPLALSLHVQLSDKSFRSDHDADIKKHLKIEVFFNGQLSSCRLIPTHDITTGAQSMHQVYAGYRTDFLAERPWILLPPGIAVDGMSQKELADPATVQQRWNEICAALLEECDHRGMDRNGNVPPTSAFLKDVSSMSMPQQIANMHDRGGRSFGIIDVVITCGEGKKVTTGTTYLKRPQRLPDPAFPIRAGLFSSSQDAEGETDDDVLQSDGVYEQSDANRTSVSPRKPRTIETDSSAATSNTPIQHQSVLPTSLQTAASPAGSSFPATSVQVANMQRTPVRQVQSQDQSYGLSRPDDAISIDGTIPPFGPSGILPTSMNSSQLFANSDRLDSAYSARTQSATTTFSRMMSSPLAQWSTDQASLNHTGVVSQTPVLNSQDSPEAANVQAMTGAAIYPDLEPMSAFNTTAPYHTQGIDITGTSFNPWTHNAAGSFGGIPVGLPRPPLSGSFQPPSSATFPFNPFNAVEASIKPPIGLMAVTTRPRRSQSPVKKQAKESSAATSSVLFVSSLIIRGHSGVTVVERRWNPPRRVACNRKIDAILVPPDEAAEKSSAIKAEQKKRSGPAKPRPASSSILGIHGPKALHMIMENPEELLRKRRKQSPKKSDAPAQPDTPASTQSKATTSGANTSDRLPSSSPLSSLTNTPEPQEGLGVPSSITQLDGPFDLNPTTLPQSTNHKPSPKKSQLGNIPHLRSKPQPSAQSSPSPRLKKRKLGGGPTLPKQPRSPNRLKTTSNPILNQSCVIAFAESVDKDVDEEQGVLRQIKGERQGVFREEYVVFAMRYFIPGN